jgi:hypothetical protein
VVAQSISKAGGGSQDTSMVEEVTRAATVRVPQGWVTGVLAVWERRRLRGGCRQEPGKEAIRNQDWRKHCAKGGRASAKRGTSALTPSSCSFTFDGNPRPEGPGKDQDSPKSFSTEQGESTGRAPRRTMKRTS